MKRYAVYTRDDLDFSSVTTGTSIISCNVYDFELELEKILRVENNNKYILNKELSSWGYYFDEVDQKWYKDALIGDYIETNKGNILSSKIDMVVFNNSAENDFIKMKDEEILEVVINRNSLMFNSHIKICYDNIKCINLNKLLH